MAPPPPIIRYDHGISAIDAGYERPNLAAIHFIIEGERAAIVDTGTNYSVDATLAALAILGISADRVEYVVLTHVHLDHAGGAGELMRRCPNAMLTVHPRGARHMIDPSRLWQATVAVYGESRAKKVYGEIVPVPKNRVIETPDGVELSLAGRTLVFRDTPGHARHQVAMVDGRSGHVFVGDTLGLSYRELDHAGRNFIVPTSSPTQFEPDALHRSLDLIAGYRPEAAYLTHFSQVRDVPRLVANLHRLVDAYADLGRRHRDDGEHRFAKLHDGMRHLVLEECTRQGLPFSEERLLEVLSIDIELNAQGLGSWLDAQSS